MKSFLLALVALVVISVGANQILQKLVFPAQTQVLHLEMLGFLIER